MSFRESISKQRQLRIDAGLLREIRTIGTGQGVVVRRAGKTLTNFSSNDYLGLASSEELKHIVSQSVAKWGVGAGASHLVCGHQHPHEQLENEIAQFVGAEKAIVFSTGYMANLAVPNTLLGRHDLLLQDKLNHASLIDAGMLCRSEVKRFRHLDVGHASQLVSGVDEKLVLVATDGVFSMNGNVADVKALARICDLEDRLLLVDDAHGFGVLGKNGSGTLEQSGLKPKGQRLMVGTLSKAVGSFGAFVAGDAVFIDHLTQHARPYIYTTALPPAIIEASREGIRRIQSQPWRREKLNENVFRFRELALEHDIELLPSETPIQSIVFQSPQRAVEASQKLEEEGFLVVAVRPPTVPEGTSRLRITISAAHEEKQLLGLVSSLKE